MDPPARKSDDTTSDARDGASTDTELLRELVERVLIHAVHAARFTEVTGDDGTGPVQQICREARIRGLRAEQLIIIMKDSWYRMPETRRLQFPHADDVLARVITTCIEEYYGHLTRRRED
jgi:hypothetical protein